MDNKEKVNRPLFKINPLFLLRSGKFLKFIKYPVASQVVIQCSDTVATPACKAGRNLLCNES